MSTPDHVRSHILEVVTRAPNRRIRPVFLGRTLRRECHPSKAAVRKALGDLIRARKLVYTYRDPCSFVEIPPEGGARTL